MIVLDTTVLIYSAGSDHQLREPSRALIAAITESRVEATTSVEVVEEFVHVRARRHGRQDAAERGRELLALLSPLLTPREAELAMGLQLYEEHDRLGMFGAVLAATTMLSGASALISADRAFASVRGLPHLDPADPEVMCLIEA